MSDIKIVVSENQLRQLVFEYLTEKLGEICLTPDDVKIEVKSKQNYRAEWETAAFRATVNKTL